MTKKRKTILKMILWTGGFLAFIIFSDYLAQIEWLKWITTKTLFLILLGWFIILAWAGITGLREK